MGGGADAEDTAWRADHGPRQNDHAHLLSHCRFGTGYYRSATPQTRNLQDRGGRRGIEQCVRRSFAERTVRA